MHTGNRRRITSSDDELKEDEEDDMESNMNKGQGKSSSSNDSTIDTEAKAPGKQSKWVKLAGGGVAMAW